MNRAIPSEFYKVRVPDYAIPAFCDSEVDYYDTAENIRLLYERSLTGRNREEAERLAASGDWGGTAAAIRESYASWTARQTYLHIVTSHDAVDGAEAMYHRALAFAESEEDSELRAELADLRDQLRLLAEMEEFSLRNVLYTPSAVRRR